MKCSHWCEYVKVTATQSRPGFKPRSGHRLGSLTPPRFVKSQQNDKVNHIFAVEAPEASKGAYHCSEMADRVTQFANGTSQFCGIESPPFDQTFHL